MATRGDRVKNILKELNPTDPEVRSSFSDGFRKDYQLGREDTQMAFYRKRDLQGKQKEAPRAETLFSTHPGMTRLREATGNISPEHQQALVEQNMHLETDQPLAYQLGQFGGTLAADVTQDASRSVWWLINALQASGEVVNELALSNKRIGTPELWQRSPVQRQSTSKSGKVLETRDLTKGVDLDMDYARREGMLTEIDGVEKPARGYSWGYNNKGDEVLEQRNYSPGMLAALAIPTGLAINNGLGLLTPLGGAQGFKAAAPDPDDPTKTNNVVSEIAQKYVLGKTGGLLPYNEFKKVRPDVSKAEYASYQADKFDNSEDLNILDGDFSLLGGALKGNTDGILGPEVSMLGRSLPVTTGVIPFLGALGGNLIGARVGHHKYKKGAAGALVGGLGGLAVGTISGHIIEGERRRRNGIENGELPMS